MLKLDLRFTYLVEYAMQAIYHIVTFCAPGAPLQVLKASSNLPPHFSFTSAHFLVNEWLTSLKKVLSFVRFSRKLRKKRPGLPDDIFSNQKIHFGKILEGLAKERVGIFCAYLVYLKASWSILWPFGTYIL
jgi:hypothetical protein